MLSNKIACWFLSLVVWMGRLSQLLQLSGLRAYFYRLEM